MVFNELTGFVMGLIVIGMIVYAGVVVMDKMSSTANIDPGSKFYNMTTTIDNTMNDGIGWVSIIIVAAAAVMVLGLLFRVFGGSS